MLPSIRRMVSDHTPFVQSAKSDVPMMKLRSCREQRTIAEGSPDIHIKTKTMHILVDHTKLMAQSAVPVNMFTFFKEELIGCGLVKRSWLKSCAAAGCLFGRWLKPVRGSYDTGTFPPKEPTWEKVFKFFSSILVAVVIIPLPFHIRVGVYAYTEATEMLHREEAAATLGFQRPYYESFWFGVHWYVVVGIVYAIYVVTISIYALVQYWFYVQFDDIIQDCIFDLREVSYSSLQSMLFYHLVVPFKEFGFLIGLIVAIPYYIVILPLAMCVAIFYGMPTLYMIGRLFYNFRPEALSEPMCCGRNKNNLIEVDKETESVNSSTGLNCGGLTFNQLYNLDRISPDTRLYPRLPVHRLKKHWSVMNRTNISRFLLPIVISSVTILLMLTLTFMYAEALRFFVHMLLLALAGLVLNAKYIMDYFIMVFWTFMYCVKSLKTVHSKYNQMSQHLFAFLKDHLKTKVADATRVPHKFQVFTAFKYFESERLADIKERMRLYMNPEDIDEDLADTEDRLKRNDSGNLEWDVHGLVFFVDTQDLPRIPRRLFWKICDGLRAPGCPGPLRHSIAQACKQLLYMLMFLFVIYIIIMSFHAVFDPTSNNQLLLTLAGGFLPLIIRQLIPGSPTVDLSEYSLKGKIEEMLLHYRESWPVYDVDADGDDDEKDNVPGMNRSLSITEEHVAPRNEEAIDRWIEEDIIEEDIIAAANIGNLEAAPASNKQPEAAFIPMRVVPTTSMDEGSVAVEFDEPAIRIAKYIPKERILTFATISGPKEERDATVLEPVVRSGSNGRMPKPSNDVIEAIF
jgi:ABC-type multidrug transport system fused ATPase/permease subunit